MRQFSDKPAVRERVPLLIGLVGPSSSGKTYSALRLAAGMQRVIGGEVFGIDTEAKRMLNYSDKFQFRHVPFEPPFGPLDYLAAIEHCMDKGAKIIVIDSMTHEHSGVGGVMDQSETFLEKKCGDDWKCRERNLMISLVKPKTQRKKLNARIVQLGINLVMCYRAHEKIKPVKGGEPLKMGWQPETTSPLHYDMTQRFLLTPGCDGVPTFNPEAEAEKQIVKNPMQFRDMFKPGVQLSEDVGEKLAVWATGANPKVVELISRYAACQGPDTFEKLEAEREVLWKVARSDEKISMKSASDAARERTRRPPPEGYVHGVDDPALAGKE
jgi:hypothetical protein